ncbi:pyridoxal phosphate-dependent aminotransferase [Streptomyces sp. NPDC049813]|uniref:pyridoxal phosphate-dependent aminotransferase n=1 Tax=Streptomyces sp. NPDC049813 TaxID=3365597 RepID=UPI0037B485DA
MPTPVPMSATLAADAVLVRRQRAGQRILPMSSGEIGLPVLPELAARLARAAHRTAYGPVTGSLALRTAAAGYWTRRGLDTAPEQVVAGPGSKALLFALQLAIGGDVIVPVPGWVSYGAQTRLTGGTPLPVPVAPGRGGVPDPDLLREAVARARAAGRDPRTVVVTVPDNPTGTVAPAGTVRRLAAAARALDLVIVSDEIYHDLVHDPAAPPVSPARFAPERTVVTTGLTKNLAVGGWRTGVARLPDGEPGRTLHTALASVASQIWSSPPAPVQEAAAYALAEPAEVVARVEASRRLHATVARAVAARLTDAGAVLAPIVATCYLYPDLESRREQLTARGVTGGESAARWLLDRHGVGVLPAGAFGEPDDPLRLRVATSRLYGTTDAEREAALAATDPLRLPWIADAIDHAGTAFAHLTAMA